MNFRNKLDKALEWVLIIVFSVLVLDVLWQVMSRYVLKSPSSFTDELAGYLLIWVGLLGAAYVTGKNGHLAIDILIQKASPARKRYLSLIIQFIVALFSLFVLIIGGTWLVYTRFLFNVNSAAMQLPLGYVYMVIPIGGLLILYYSLYNVRLILKSKIN